MRQDRTNRSTSRFKQRVIDMSPSRVAPSKNAVATTTPRGDKRRQPTSKSAQAKRTKLSTNLLSHGRCSKGTSDESDADVDDSLESPRIDLACTSARASTEALAPSPTAQALAWRGRPGRTRTHSRRASGCSFSPEGDSTINSGHVWNAAPGPLEFESTSFASPHLNKTWDINPSAKPS